MAQGQAQRKWHFSREIDKGNLPYIVVALCIVALWVINQWPARHKTQIMVGLSRISVQLSNMWRQGNSLGASTGNLSAFEGLALSENINFPPFGANFAQFGAFEAFQFPRTCVPCVTFTHPKNLDLSLLSLDVFVHVVAGVTWPRVICNPSHLMKGSRQFVIFQISKSLKNTFVHFGYLNVATKREKNREIDPNPAKSNPKTPLIWNTGSRWGGCLDVRHWWSIALNRKADQTHPDQSSSLHKKTMPTRGFEPTTNTSELKTELHHPFKSLHNLS